MLFDLGMSELLLIGVVALVVIGPKDLPKALRVAGFWVKKARTLSREFQNSVEQMIREAELDEMRQELKKRYGQKTRLQLVTPARSLFGRRIPGISPVSLEGVTSGLAAGLVEAAEEKAMWSRYGL